MTVYLVMWKSKESNGVSAVFISQEAADKACELFRESREDPNTAFHVAPFLVQSGEYLDDTSN